MKYKIIATIVILLIIIASLAMKGCSSNTPATNEYGEPVQTQEFQQ
jgi:uncharacterized membrane protein YhaH (DUF805 family)